MSVELTDHERGYCEGRRRGIEMGRKEERTLILEEVNARIVGLSKYPEWAAAQDAIGVLMSLATFLAESK